ncbi:hypothetical protein BDR04DRAFT_476924 [Suillus decipiens]|nr:hypothetical protein BDR04DRAFT_476924 [Suillus decipiens]
MSVNYRKGISNAVSSHLRRYGITGPDTPSTSCTWTGCSKTLERGGMARHVLAHLSAKVHCSVCGVVKCRYKSFMHTSNSQRSADSHWSISSSGPKDILSQGVEVLYIRSNDTSLS